MKILKLIRNYLSQGYYAWAMSEIKPTHHDVPRIVVRQRELKDEAVRIFS